MTRFLMVAAGGAAGAMARYADRVVVMDHGRVAADGPPREALAPAVLKDVFGVGGRWLETPQGPVLSTWRIAAN